MPNPNCKTCGGTGIDPGGLPACRTCAMGRRQYYCKVETCPARNSSEATCIWWHDEGTGPRANEDSSQIRSWRVIPTHATSDPAAHQQAIADAAADAESPSADRERFEAAYRERVAPHPVQDVWFEWKDGQYTNSHMQARWEGWLDANATLHPRIEALIGTAEQWAAAYDKVMGGRR